MKDRYFLHTVRENTKHTKKDLEELVAFLNAGCEIMEEIHSSGNEHCYILYNDQEEKIKETN